MRKNTSAKTVVRCVLYLRISLDHTGEGLAIERQRRECRRIALARGWVIIREYVDESISAFKRAKKRPGYEQMVADYKAGMFEAIVVWDLDRLTRQPRQLEDWIEAAEDRGLKLVTANGEADLTVDAGRMFARIKAAVARQESERKAARQTAAARQRAQLGRAPLGTRLMGYTTDGRLAAASWCDVATRREVGEVDMIREMFTRFHAGDSLTGVAAWWKGTGFPTRHGSAPNSSTVRDILTNPRYKGVVIYDRHNGGDQAAEAVFPAIIDEGTWEAVNVRLADPRRRKQQGTDRKHLGAGLYLCPNSHPVRSHGTPTRYRCAEGCVTRAAAPIDAAVMALTRARLRWPDVAALVSAPASREAREAGADLRKQRRRLLQVEQDYDSDLIDGKRYKEKREKIEAEIQIAEARLTRLSAGSEVAGTLTAADPVAAFDSAPLGVQQAVIRFFMEVRLLSAPRGRKGFDPETIRITPRHPAGPDLHAA